LGYSDHHPLAPTEFIPATGQGAIAITARSDDDYVLDQLSTLEDSKTRISCEAERQYLITLEGGCQVPAGIYSQIKTKNDKAKIELTGFISTLDGRIFIRDNLTGGLDDAEQLAKSLAQQLLSAGGREILDQIRTGGQA
jgi:hydroxymethylbilane synthase